MESIILNSSFLETKRPGQPKERQHIRRQHCKIFGVRLWNQEVRHWLISLEEYIPPLATIIDSRSFVSAIGLPTIFTRVRRRNPAEFVDFFNLREAFAPSWLSNLEKSLINRPDVIDSVSQSIVNTGIPRAIANNKAGVRLALGDRTKTEAYSTEDGEKPLKPRKREREDDKTCVSGKLSFP